MFTIFTLPTNFVASTTAIMGSLFSDLSPFITLILGVILATLVVTMIINTLTK